ncbi:DHA2 family efflux MFS transporter permease subunit [Methanolacinia petrolearia]|uniref:DHA2 family efflux MFS transporter permease subunit n=1 Tax=Methanolacinia petrolearia TaxID=54120 RepID=UPI003BAA6D81
MIAEQGEKDGRYGHWPVLFLLSLATAIELIDGTALNISLPTIASDFNINLGAASWIPMVYFLTISCLLLPFAKVSEKTGTRKILFAGLLLFTVSSYFCAISGRIELLIFFRFLQATGGAMMAAAVPAQVAIGFTPETRGRALGIIMGAGGFGLAAGPAIGGYITHFISWHWIFYINIPIGIIGMALTYFCLKPYSPAERSNGFDYSGLVFMSLFMVSFLFLLTKGSEYGWSSTETIITAAVSILALVIFIILEKRSKDPILDMSIFLSWTFLLSTAFLLVFEILLGGIELILPFYLEKVLEFTPDISGLYMLIPPMIMIIAGPAGGFLSDYEGNRMVCSISALIGIIAFVIFLISLTSPGMIIYMVIALILFGMAIGAVASFGASRIIEHSPKGLEITGSAISDLVFYIGMSLGTAIYTLILQSGMTSTIINSGKISINDVSAYAFSSAMPYIYIFSIILMAAALLFALLVPDKKRAAEPRNITER